jgi:hypothetical protein
VRVTVKTDKTAYPANARPKFTVLVENKGGAACSVDLGPRSLVWTVKSGDDRIWSSTDCLTGGAPDIVQLQPNQSTTRTYDWRRVRSRPACPSGQPAVKAGYYKVSATVVGAGPSSYAFRLS